MPYSNYMSDSNFWQVFKFYFQWYLHTIPITTHIFMSPETSFMSPQTIFMFPQTTFRSPLTISRSLQTDCRWPHTITMCPKMLSMCQQRVSSVLFLSPCDNWWLIISRWPLIILRYPQIIYGWPQSISRESTSYFKVSRDRQQGIFIVLAEIVPERM